MRLILLTFLAAITMSSCEELNIESPFKADDVVTYTIEQGEHNVDALPRIFSESEMVFKATFDETAQYKTEDPDNQSDINKLYGFSYCGDQHHENSARFGWRWYQDELQILTYTYVDGNRNYEFLTTVSINESNTYKITISETSYVFSINDQSLKEILRSSCDDGTNYYLYPYFGGDETAPHDIAITIEIVE